jgi:uncharacterized protein with GYD domain
MNASMEKSGMSKELRRKQKAYILIRVQPGRETELYDELKQIPNIVGIDFVRGAFDFVVIAEGEASEIDALVLRIRKSPYLVNTETMTAFETVPWQEVTGQLDYGHV